MRAGDLSWRDHWIWTTSMLIYYLFDSGCCFCRKHVSTSLSYASLTVCARPWAFNSRDTSKLSTGTKWVIFRFSAELICFLREQYDRIYRKIHWKKSRKVDQALLEKVPIQWKLVMTTPHSVNCCGPWKKCFLNVEEHSCRTITGQWKEQTTLQ